MIFTQELKRSFKNHIAQRGGLYFKDHDLKSLESAILERAKSLSIDSMQAYYNYLIASEEKEDEFRELLNLLTINHTYFFRNEPHFKVLREKILPEIINRRSSFVKREALHVSQDTLHKQKPAIRIWSAGCSTGQEPYSIAILLKELIKDISEWDIYILATDASEQALSMARAGVYSNSSMKHVPEEYIDKYFTKIQAAGGKTEHAIDERIKNMVTFAFFNLMEDSFPSEFDIILCRNVVIYFELETTLKIMNKLHSSLIGSGYFFIGYSETLQFMPDKFQMVASEDAIYYRKPEKDAHIKKEVLIDEDSDVLDKALDELSREQAIAELEAEVNTKSLAPGKIEDILVEIIKLTHLKEYDKALGFIDEAIRIDEEAIEPYYLAAEILLNQGDTVKAREMIDRALKLNSLFAPAHYLLGCINIEQNKSEEAKESLKRAMFIEKDFLLAHFYMANIYRDQGDIGHAIREYRNTLKVLSKSSPFAIIAYSGGFNTATFMSLCKDNIERLKKA